MQVAWCTRYEVEERVAGLIRPADIVLDIGPGIRPQRLVTPYVHICAEPHGEYVEHLLHEVNAKPFLRGRFVVLRADWAAALELLGPKSVDTVFLLDVIEHLPKAEGTRLLALTRNVARSQIVVFTPLGFVPQAYAEGQPDRWGMHGGNWQEHKSGWTPDDFDESWQVLAVKEYHVEDEKGNPIVPPYGAIWAVQDLRSPADSGAVRDEPAAELLPLVSVIIAANREAPDVRRAIESVLSQSYPRVECVLLDDGSAAEAVKGLRILRVELPAVGETPAANIGLSIAKGRFVAVLNPNVQLGRETVTKAVERLINEPELLGVYGNWAVTDESGNLIRYGGARECDCAEVLRWHHWQGPVLFLRREVAQKLGGLDRRFRFLADFDLWVRAALMGPLIKVHGPLASVALTGASDEPGRADARAPEEHVRLVSKIYSMPGLPSEVLKAKREAYSGAHYAAGHACGKAHVLRRKWHFVAAILYLFPFRREHRHKYSERIAMSARELIGPLYPPLRTLLRRLFVPRPPTGAASQ